MNFTTELLISELKTAKENYVHLGRSIEKNWNDLQRLRIEQGYASRNLAVQKTEQSDILNFYNQWFDTADTPVYSIIASEEPQINNSKPQHEIERLSLISKYRYQLIIHFNKISVCKTPYRALNTDFSCNFDEIYRLRVSFIAVASLLNHYMEPFFLLQHETLFDLAEFSRWDEASSH
ncbi:unnamed protein product [Dracunculus medinensis]|uniref:CC2D2AN-C2 domain-containing protein n=1 Tax=Dracunculus medinensis TaxID=318479 RepID=A0A0N4U7A0_DRAME|nr:unnamed protein product [Dracunculus medinensis]